MDHTTRAFDADLHALGRKVVEMGRERVGALHVADDIRLSENLLVICLPELM